MNFADSEVVASILKKDGYKLTDKAKDANLVLLNTCSIRDKAEQTVRNKLKNFNSQKKENKDLKVGLLGCMAERLKEKLLDQEKIVDLVVGPDSYKDLPNLLDQVEHNQKAVNVILSKSEILLRLSKKCTGHPVRRSIGFSKPLCPKQFGYCATFAN